MCDNGELVAHQGKELVKLDQFLSKFTLASEHLYVPFMIFNTESFFLIVIIKADSESTKINIIDSVLEFFGHVFSVLMHYSLDLFLINFGPKGSEFLPEWHLHQIIEFFSSKSKTMDMLDDGLIDEFWDLVLDEGVLIDNLSFTDSHSQEDLIEQPIPDSNLALHDEQHLENFLELVLNDVISDIIVSWF